MPNDSELIKVELQFTIRDETDTLYLPRRGTSDRQIKEMLRDILDDSWISGVEISEALDTDEIYDGDVVQHSSGDIAVVEDTDGPFLWVNPIGDGYNEEWERSEIINRLEQ